MSCTFLLSSDNVSPNISLLKKDFRNWKRLSIFTCGTLVLFASSRTESSFMAVVREFNDWTWQMSSTFSQLHMSS